MTTRVHINVAATIAETVAARVARTGCNNATYYYYYRMHREGDAVALLKGHQTCDLQVAGRVLAGHHCVVALGKLLRHVCLCHQAV